MVNPRSSQASIETLRHIDHGPELRTRNSGRRLRRDREPILRQPRSLTRGRSQQSFLEGGQRGERRPGGWGRLGRRRRETHGKLAARPSPRRRRAAGSGALASLGLISLLSILILNPNLCCHNFNFTKYWKGSIGQYFILDNVHPHPVKSFLSWISLEALDVTLMTKSISLPQDARIAVLRQLKAIDGNITDGRKWLYDMGVIDLDLDRDCLLGHTYARYILSWHVATSICSYGLSKENASNEELVKNHGVATKLSGYCAYLLAFKPDMVPDATCTSLSMARGTLQNARDYLADCKSNEEKYAKLIELGGSGSTDYDVRFLSEGATIAVYLVRIESDDERWRVLAIFWANLMLWIASSDRAVAHATRMATGGEFITIIWALLTHAHVVDKLQPPGGAPGL